MKEYPFERRTLGWLLRDKAARNRDRTFIRFKDAAASYAEVDRTSNRVASALGAMGVRRRDKVCLLLKNSPEFLLAWFGVSKLGAVEVPVNVNLKGDLLRYVINDSEAGLVIMDHEFVDRYRAVEQGLPRVKGVVVRGGEHGSTHGLGTPSRPYADLLNGSDAFELPEIAPSDPISIMYTSGTTGPSKGVLMPHRQFYEWGHDYAVHLGICPDDVLYTCLPFFHGTSHFIVTMMALLSDATLAIGEHFSATEFWNEVVAHGATFAPLVGSMATILYSRPPQPAEKTHNVRLIYSLPAPRDIYDQFEKRFGVKLVEAYGLTEVNALFFNPLDATRKGSCGKPVENYEVRLVDECDRDVPPGETGEIVARPKEPYSMMLEYYNKPQDTVRSWRNLWFHTGDLARSDADGYYYFVDRKKDSIRRKGENVSSYEVEKVLCEHPGVLECAVIGIDSALGEQEIKACVRLKPDAELAPEDLIDFCQDRMAYFMVPRFLEFKKALPKTPNGKVEKYKLKQEGIGASTWDLAKSGITLRR